MECTFNFHTKIICGFLLVVLVGILPTKGQSSFFDSLPEDGEPLVINMTLDLRKLIRRKAQEEYFKSSFTYQDGDEKVEWNVKIKARGNIRKTICFYPPLMLKFKKDHLREKGLKDINKYKLVVNCKGSKITATYVQKELLAYKLYNEIGDFSFRVKPLLINFIDPEDASKVTQLNGFIIENEIEMARRYDAVQVLRKRFSQKLIDKNRGQIMGVFQFMIGNTDWTLGNLHNTKLIKVPEIPKVVAVPYDFDYSGLVNASYAVPHHKIPIKSVVERYYMGLKCTEGELAVVKSKFEERKDVLLDIVRNTRLLSSRDRTLMEKYIEGFYKILTNSKKAKRYFLVG